MKERPILFSAPMVRAILEGRKTTTRRMVKPQPEMREVAGVASMLSFKTRRGAGWWLWPNARDQVLAECPYGQPGDRLWVRETCGTGGYFKYPWAYRADGVEYPGEHWTPSIHMPRRASRITLEVTGLRVERLQDITPAQILAEGVRIPATPDGQALIDISTKHCPAHFLPKLNGASSDDLLRAHWAALWVQINGIESWHANPWVWAVEFKRVEAPIS